MLDFFRKLFTYDEWAIRRSLASIGENDESKAVLMLSHILFAEKIWLMRLKGEDSSTVPTFQKSSLAECAKMAAEILQAYKKYLDSLTEKDLDKAITYKNTQGVEYQTPVREILTHVGLHGVYHRGQIAWLVRENGGTAVNTDYITFTRL